MPEVLEHLEALTAAGVLVGTGETWAVAPAERHRVMLELARRGELDRLADVVRSARPPKVTYSSSQGSWWDILREIRFDLYMGRWTEAQSGLK